MANGTTRLAQANLTIKGKSPTSEMNEEMITLSQKQLNKIPLKAAKSEHNHSK